MYALIPSDEISLCFTLNTALLRHFNGKMRSLCIQLSRFTIAELLEYNFLKGLNVFLLYLGIK